MDYVYCYICSAPMKTIKKEHEVEFDNTKVLLDLNCLHCDVCNAEGYSQDMEDDNDEKISKCKYALNNQVLILKRKGVKF